MARVATDPVAEHRTAMDVASTYVERVRDADLRRPTPCAGWDLGQLLEHMVGQHAGFSAVVRDGAADAAAYRPQPFSATSWRRSVDDLLDAFAGADLAAEVVEVELHPTRPLPVAVLVQAQFLDTVVHTWDVAAALGERFDPGPDVAAAVEAIAAPIPDDERRDAAGAAFARAVPTGGGPWERALGLLGRDPGWHA
jgi:uncharacterized protein (TIGR03086 family)